MTNDQPIPDAQRHRAEQLQQFCGELGLDTGHSPKEEATLALVNEALTHTSAGRPLNHERLEFLGDAVLRLAASEFIEQHHPQLPVGERSALRAQLVSDRWLASLGETIGIERVLEIGAKARGDTAGRATLQAEASEALIGAIYQAWGSLAPVHTWLTPHWQRTSAAVLADPHKGNAKSALQEWSQARKLGLPVYNSLETSRRHGDPRRFHCQVKLKEKTLAEGWGGSRRDAEQRAAQAALQDVEGDGVER
ncbi:ribonuclease III [Synechococcus sp. UW140]|uniref:ribonuclease III n=1 Tax=Synechococcus sp. UW140 TaxID=368503 RepID=UPI001FCB555F|nr:ribonuclease III [Synechococcus sp. UW140]